MQSVGQQNKICSFQVLGVRFWKQKIFFLSKQRRKTSNCFGTVYSLCDKIEEHS